MSPPTRGRWRRTFAWSLATLTLCAPLHAARPTIEDALKSTADAAARAADPSRAAADRAAALDESIRERQTLLALGADDDRLATWLLDQAEAVLLRAGRDGAELSVLYGVPTPEQRTRMRAAATEASALVARAGRAADDSVARLQARVFAARGDAEAARRASAEIEPKMRTLIDVEQAWRAPFTGARTALITAASIADPVGVRERRRLAGEAATALGAIVGPDPLAESERLLLDATARWLAGDRAAAHALFDKARAAADPGLGRIRASIGLALTAPDLAAAEGAARELAAPTGAADVLRLLRCEAAARAVMTLAPPDPAARLDAQRSALAGLGALELELLSSRSGTPLQALLEEKLAVAAEPGAELGLSDDPGAAPPVMYARGVALLRRTTDADARAEGAALLQRVIEADAGPVVREAAMWAVGSMLSADVQRRRGEPVSPAAALVALAREFPASPRFADAVERGAALLRAALATPDGQSKRRFALQRELIEIAMRTSPPAPGADQLRSEYALNHARDPDVTLDPPTVQRVLAALPARPAPSPELAADERNVEVIVTRAVALAARGGDAAATSVAVARTATEWAVRVGSSTAARYRLLWAEGLVTQGGDGDAASAIEHLDEIGPPESSPLTPDERVRARLTRGRAQRMAGHDADAFATLRALAEELDAPAPTPAQKRPGAFWAAWAEMLEILQSQNADGARTATIRLQINRLALIDPDFGAADAARRIRALRDSLK